MQISSQPGPQKSWVVLAWNQKVSLRQRCTKEHVDKLWKHCKFKSCFQKLVLEFGCRKCTGVPAGGDAGVWCQPSLCCHQRQIIILESTSLLLVEETDACAVCFKQSYEPFWKTQLWVLSELITKLVWFFFFFECICLERKLSPSLTLFRGPSRSKT